MSNLVPLIVGGVIPALMYGAAGIFQKMSAREGGSATSYLIYFGAATALSGLIWRVILKESWGTPRSAGLAFVAGLVFSMGAGLISMAMINYQAAVSQLSPLYNMNVLVTVGLGLLILSEHQSLDVTRLLAGAALIAIGAVLVSGA
jgi:uncharacterized membrane protein